MMSSSWTPQRINWDIGWVNSAPQRKINRNFIGGFVGPEKWFNQDVMGGLIQMHNLDLTEFPLCPLLRPTEKDQPEFHGWV